MTPNDRIDIFAELGSLMLSAAAGENSNRTSGLIRAIETCQNHNPWFTPDNIRRALTAHGEQLQKQNLTTWLSRYSDYGQATSPATVAVIMAGNIPAVGFHDMLCVLITGNILLAKTSSKDDLLIRELASALTSVEPALAGSIAFSEDSPGKFDKVIATGSDNSSRYFEYYFGRYPRLIRKNRTSAAIIEGTETDEQLERLGDDIFSYYGLGCRNVTKLFLPPGYKLNRLADAWEKYSVVSDNRKYRANYVYQKAVMEVNREVFTDTGFALLKSDRSLFPQVAVINYEELGYENAEDELKVVSDKIQVITGARHTPFGFAQKPKLWDYSDDIDTIGFLSK